MYLQLLTNEDLIEIGITKKGHRLILLNAVTDEYFTLLSPNPGYNVSIKFNNCQYMYFPLTTKETILSTTWSCV